MKTRNRGILKVWPLGALRAGHELDIWFVICSTWWDKALPVPGTVLQDVKFEGLKNPFTGF
jgi:hypothetical protein